MITVWNKAKDWLRIRRNTVITGSVGSLLGVLGGHLHIAPVFWLGIAIFMVALAASFLLKGKF